MLCASEDDPTDEDVIPKWLLRAFGVQEGSTTVSVAEEAGDKQQIGALRHFQFTLNGGVCRKCNNERLGGLEQIVQPILLEPMAVRCQPTTLDLANQRLRGRPRALGHAHRRAKERPRGVTCLRVHLPSLWSDPASRSKCSASLSMSRLMGRPEVAEVVGRVLPDGLPCCPFEIRCSRGTACLLGGWGISRSAGAARPLHCGRRRHAPWFSLAFNRDLGRHPASVS